MTKISTIAARATTVAKVELTDASNFIKLYHRQGMPRLASGARAYGLYSDDELLAVAIFCNPRTRGMQKRYTTELLRMAFKKNVRVQGGASKLIKSFLRTGPIDLFTYQDLNGEKTSVYEKAGMKLVAEKSKKEILVAAGKTAATAENNRKDWFSLEQATRFGPDSLLGTTLGEVEVNGKRLSNIELFQSLGYRLETVPGDRIYEWRNPDVRFYTYKITSEEAPGYYIGRKLYRGADVTEEELLLDGYFGSGGKKFQTWMSSVSPDSIVKEITGIYPDWPSAIKAEFDQIGNRYKEDPDCMNSQPGGMGLGSSIANMTLQKCAIHGDSIHNGKSCMKCSIAKVFAENECEVHGVTLFRGDSCIKCTQALRYSTLQCSIHGEATHRDSRCLRCSAQGAISMRHCPIHGFVKHGGEVCSSCVAAKGVSVKVCPLHGETKFRGDKCSTCSASTIVSIRVCEVHGETKHSGSHCMKCNAQGQLSRKECSVHGVTTFKGSTCARCTAEKSVSMKECPKHGLSKHQGDACNRCSTQSSISQRECPKHGMTTHQGKVCNRCNAESSVTKEECSKHGLVKFQGGVCVTCRNSKLIQEKECSTHGVSKHRGNTCMKCATSNRRKPEDILKEQGRTVTDLLAALESATLASVARDFGLSKYHIKKLREKAAVGA